MTFRTLTAGMAWVLFALSMATPSQASDEAPEPSLFGDGYGIDHAVLLVSDLEAARRHFVDTLGFSLTPVAEGGRHPTGIRNVSANFADLSYLELLAVADPALVSEHRPHYLRFLEHHQGVRLYALSTSSAQGTQAWLSARNFDVEEPASGRIERGGWRRDSSEPDWWALRFSGDEPPADLPFFIQYRRMSYAQVLADWDAGYARAREQERNQHANGALGIAALEIVVENADAARASFQRMGLSVVPGSHGRRFAIGRRQLIVRAPSDDDDAAARFLAARGPGVAAMHVEVVDLEATRAWLAERLPGDALDQLDEGLAVAAEHAYGVGLVFVQEPESNRPDPALAAGSGMPGPLSAEQAEQAAGRYQQYCALCHGVDREGYAADNAPSLRSRSLLSTAEPSFIGSSIAYGREGTAMAGYLDSQGGPMTAPEIGQLMAWLWQQGGLAPDERIKLPSTPVEGDPVAGERVYQAECAQCHGAHGEGVTAPALGHRMLLAEASDAFLRHAIAEGRDGTPMPAYRDRLSDEDIDAVTAFLRSRAAGWAAPIVELRAPPEPEQYVLNPDGPSPEFELREDRFVAAADVARALAEGERMVLLDARAMSDWQRTHIPGALPVPYYADPDTFAGDLPRDGTWIIAYCACPHAASGVVVDTLRRLNFPRTAIIDEGILVWTRRGYPVSAGR